jgi:thiosulfate reductase/polysulfide reductase chain A
MGSIEAKGGLFIKKGPADAGLKGMRKFSDAEFPPSDTKRFDGVGDKFPIVDAAHGKGQMLPYAILKEDPYPVKALIAFRFDPLLSIPDYHQNLEAVKKLDFIAAIDINYSETAWHADVILPESTYFERTDPARMIQGLKPAVFLRQQCIPPQHDTRPGSWIIKQLAERMGVGEYFPYNSIEELLNYQLADMDIDINDFAETGFVSLSDKPIWWDRENGIKFKTPSGKIEIISSLMEENGYSSLPSYKKVERLSDSFRLMIGRNAQTTHVSTQNNPYLNKLIPENTLWINKKKAEALGISDGDLVEVTSKVGKVKIKAFVTDLIHPEAVFMLHGFGQRVPAKTRCYLKGASDTDIVENTSDVIGGSPALDNTVVNVSKAAG